MRTNRVRQMLKDGQTVIGSFMGLGSPSVAELLGHAGFDFLVIETEHNALDSAEIEHMLRAVGCTEAVPHPVVQRRVHPARARHGRPRDRRALG